MGNSFTLSSIVRLTTTLNWFWCTCWKAHKRTTQSLLNTWSKKLSSPKGYLEFEVIPTFLPNISRLYIKNLRSLATFHLRKSLLQLDTPKEHSNTLTCVNQQRIVQTYYQCTLLKYQSIAETSQWMRKYAQSVPHSTVWYSTWHQWTWNLSLRSRVTI